MRALIVVSILFALCPPMKAETIRVPESYPTISLALANATAGDTVLVTGGPYLEWDLAPPAEVTLLAPGFASVKIDALQQGRHFLLVEQDARYAIEGFLLTGGRAGSGASVHSGSANVEILLRGCLFKDNECTGSGGVVYVNGSGSSLRIENSTLEGNSAGFRAGSIYVDGQTSGSELYLENTSISESSTLTGEGGAIHLRSRVTGSFYNVTLRDNNAGDRGGAMYASDWCDIVMSNCLFIGNVGNTGGDFYLAASDAQVSSSDFVGGWSEVDGDSSLALICCSFLAGADPSTWGEDIFIHDDDCDPTAVNQRRSVPYALPRLFVYPNPFNPLATIAYTIPVSGRVRLEILDLRGRMIRSLVDRNEPAGNHEVTWDGRDLRGRDVPSGVYLSRVRVAGRVARGSMTLSR